MALERPTLMKSLNGNPSRKPMLNVMDTSLHYNPFSSKNDNLKVASLSSYLRSELPKAALREDIRCEVEDSDQISVFDAVNYFNETNDQKEDKRVSSGSVNRVDRVGATNEICESSTVSRLSSVSSVDGYGRNCRAHSFHATPTASSEASWNSQTGLLSNPPGSMAVSLRNLPADNQNQKKKGSRTAAKWFLGRKCPCSGNKSVQIVEEKVSGSTSTSYPKTKSLRSVDRTVAQEQFVKSQESSVTGDAVERPEKVIPNLRRFSSDNHFSSNTAPHHHQLLRSFNDGAGFSFPILNQSSKLVLKGIPTTSPQEDPPRESLEVFQPPDESISGKTLEAQQRVPASHTRVDRDRLPGFAIPASPMYRVTTTDDDAASDASSDLFEIESFSTQLTIPYAMYHRRRDSLLDEATTLNARRIAAGTNGALFSPRSLEEPATPSVAATEGYAPSEASIDWSVTTAEGFDRASVTNFSISASDIEDFAIIRHGNAVGTSNGGGGAGKIRPGNGGLLSCRWESAVSVGPHPVKFTQRGGPTAVIGRQVGGEGTIRPQTFVNKPPLVGSRSARSTVAFAT
ncbi:hypothetical protein U1Q18_007958 [Sarracenia purpurea var. burkii]